MISKPAAFFDRDGVICEYVDELLSLSQFRFRPGVSDAIRILNQAGYYVFVATNQPNIAKGKMTQAESDRIHRHMVNELSVQGAFIEKVYVCPHRLGGILAELSIDCNCRKPKAGLLEQAFADFNFDRARSFMIGDTWRDIECAHRFGIPGLAVAGGGGYPYLPDSGMKVEPEALLVRPDGQFGSAFEAVEWWLGQEDAK